MRKSLFLTAVALLTGLFSVNAAGVDTFTATNFDATSNSYVTTEGVQGESGAVYTAQSATSYNAIQLRSSNSNSGIVSTTSGGYITNVTVAWNENTSNKRVLNVYGSHTPFTDPSQLYKTSDNTFEYTELGTITIANGETSLDIDGAWEYVGVRSKDGALYLDSITFTWAGEPPVVEPEPTPDPVLVYTGNGDWAPTLYGDECFVPVQTAEVEGYDQYMLIKKWAGVEGYDLKIWYDEEDNVTGI